MTSPTNHQNSLNKCKQCDFVCHDYAYLRQHIEQKHKPDSQAGDELLTANFGKWIEQNGVKLGSYSEKPFLGFVNSSVDLNTLKAAVMAYAERLAARRTVEELKTVYKDIVKHDIAGPVKWEVSDRIAAIEATLTKGETS